MNPISYYDFSDADKIILAAMKIGFYFNFQLTYVLKKFSPNVFQEKTNCHIVNIDKEIAFAFFGFFVVYQLGVDIFLNPKYII